MFKYLIYSILVLFFIGCGGSNNYETSTAYYVAPLGDDSNEGTEDSPFKSIQKVDSYLFTILNSIINYSMQLKESVHHLVIHSFVSCLVKSQYTILEPYSYWVAFY